MLRFLFPAIYAVAFMVLIHPLVVRVWLAGWLHFLPGFLMPEPGEEPEWAVTASVAITTGLVGFCALLWLVLGRAVTAIVLILVVFPVTFFGWIRGWLSILGPDFLMPDYEHEVEWVLVISAVLVAAALCFAGCSLLHTRPRPA